MAKRFLMFALLPVIAAAQPMGTLENGVYHHSRTGIEFTLPPDWVIVSHGHASDGATGGRPILAAAAF
jgi:hypothetical protein